MNAQDVVDALKARLNPFVDQPVTEDTVAGVRRAVEDILKVEGPNQPKDGRVRLTARVASQMGFPIDPVEDDKRYYDYRLEVAASKDDPTRITLRFVE